MTKTFISLSVLIFLVSGCVRKESQYDEAKLLYNEAMKIHDEVMPRMDEMYSLELKLKSMRDSLSVDTLANSVTIHQIKERLSSLDESGKKMMDWMHKIKDIPGHKAATTPGHHQHTEISADGNENPDIVLQIQREQKTRIDSVRKEMLRSIEEARDMLRKKGHAY